MSETAKKSNLALWQKITEGDRGGKLPEAARAHLSRMRKDEQVGALG